MLAEAQMVYSAFLILNDRLYGRPSTSPSCSLKSSTRLPLSRLITLSCTSNRSSSSMEYVAPRLSYHVPASTGNCRFSAIFHRKDSLGDRFSQLFYDLLSVSFSLCHAVTHLMRSPRSSSLYQKLQCHQGRCQDCSLDQPPAPTLAPPLAVPSLAILSPSLPAIKKRAEALWVLYIYCPLPKHKDLTIY